MRVDVQVALKPLLSAESKFRRKKPNKSKEYVCHSNYCGTNRLWKHLKNSGRNYPYKMRDKVQITLNFQLSIDGLLIELIIDGILFGQTCYELVIIY